MLLSLVLLPGAAPAARASAASETPRTLVVRGRVLKADGSPLAGARLSARGSATVSTLSDDRGHYSIEAGMGAPVALKRGAFHIEIRAESGGGRLACAAGGPALAIDVSVVRGTDHVRVRSNAAGATAAVITAFAQDRAPTAWVDADFGGAGSTKGALELKSVDEVAVEGLGPPTPMTPATAGTTEKSAPSAPGHRKSREPAPAAETARTERAKPQPVAAGDAWRTRDSLAAVTQANRHAADSAARAQVELRRRSLALAESARRDSVTRAKAARRRADSLASVARHAAPPLPAAVAKRAEAGGADSCDCRIRGTVEVAWEERPLEENLPVTVTLETGNAPEQALELYLGAPREFHFGPLPCRDHVLRVRTDGRLHYSVGRGDSLVTLHCRGNTQVRLVLTPQKR